MHRRRSIRIRLAALAIACSGIAASCGAAQQSAAPGSPGTGTASPPPAASTTPSVAPTTDPGLDAARAAIEATDLTDPATLDAILEIRSTDAGIAGAAAAIEGGATGDALWAATWIYAAFGTDAEVLVPVLSTTDPTVRAMAAAALTGWGQRDGIAVLVELLSADGYVRGAEPPMTIAAFASASLDRFVAGPTIEADATFEDRAAAWTAWLTANEATLQFDLDTARWSAR